MRTLILVVALLIGSPSSVRAQIMPGMPPDLCAGSADTIAAGQTLTVSGPLTKGCLGVKGSLVLANGANLTATTIYVYSGARVTNSGPNVAVHIADVAPNTTSDPERFGTGILAVGTGYVHLNGIPRTGFV